MVWLPSWMAGTRLLDRGICGPELLEQRFSLPSPPPFMSTLDASQREIPPTPVKAEVGTKTYPPHHTR